MKLTKPKLDVKPSTVYITKAQMTLLMEIGAQEIRPIVFTNRESLELRFRCYYNNIALDRSKILALINKQLLRMDFSLCLVVPTKLGMRMLKIKSKNSTKSGMVFIPRHLVRSNDLNGASKFKVAKGIKIK